VRRFDAAFFPSLAWAEEAEREKERKKESGVKPPHSKVHT
jgi:hypothetical protein